MKRNRQQSLHISAAFILAFVASSALADSAGPSYAAEQCTNYNRPKPNNVQLTEADARECCNEWAGDVEENKQKTFAAKCTKRVIEIEKQNFPSGGGNK